MDTPRHLASLAEIALVAVSLAAAFSLERLFEDSTPLQTLFIAVGISHLLAMVPRRLGLDQDWSAIISSVGAVLFVSSWFYLAESFYGLPTLNTWRALWDDFLVASEAFEVDIAPVEPLQGYVVGASLLLWIAAFIADGLAFRTKQLVLAILPAFSLLIFSIIFGAERNAVVHGIALSATSGVFLLVMLTKKRASDWDTDEGNDFSWTTLGGGAMIVAAVVAIGALAAPQIFASQSQPVVDLTQLNNPPPLRSIENPLVNVAASLIQQSDQEVFSVKVNPGDFDYWRLMSLTDFDGRQWSRTSKFSDIGGVARSTTGPFVRNRRSMVQTFSTQSRSSSDIYLPVAYELHQVIDDGGLSLEYEANTGALIYAQESQVLAERGFSYTVESQVPSFRPELLPAFAASEGLDLDFVAQHTLLPAICESGQDSYDGQCWSQEVGTLARQITATAETDYQRARILQDYLRNPNIFTYDLEVARTQDVRSLEDFLFEAKRGYCQQFATAFATMARSLGLPSRVAVGYTWGTWDADQSAFIVRGYNAHAWPEVYFGGVGWVSFEPTPGRARPHRSDITGLTQPQQFSPPGESEVPPEVQQATTTIPTTTLPDVGATTPTSPSGPSERSSASGTSTDGGGPEQMTGLSTAALIWIFGLAILAVLSGVVAFIILRRRRILRLCANSGQRRAELAWDDALRALETLGLEIEDHQTPFEFADFVESEEARLSAIQELADCITKARYAPDQDVAKSDLDFAKAESEAGFAQAENEAGLEQAESEEGFEAIGRRAVELSDEIIAKCAEIAGKRRTLLAKIRPRSYRRLSGRWKR